MTRMQVASFVLLFFIALWAYRYLSTYEPALMSKSRFVRTEKPVLGEGQIDVPDGGQIVYYYSPHADSGVQVERRYDALTKWVVVVAALGVEHSAYSHSVDLRIDGDVIEIFSRGMMGSFHELRELESGKLITRSEDRKVPGPN